MADTNQKKDLKTTSSKSISVHEENKSVNLFLLLPLLIIAAILPLIMRLHIYSANLSDRVWFAVEDEYADFFLYGKQVVFLSMTAYMAVVALYRSYINRKTIHYPRVLLPLAAYALLAILSTFFSKYKYYSFHGVYEQFESIFVLLGYCITTFYVYLIVQTKKDIKYILYALLVSALVLSLIGLSQVTGYDFFTTQPGWRLITDRGYWSSKDLFDFNFMGQVYLTLYNPNYVGTYTSMLLPLLVVVGLITNKIGLKITFFAASIGLLICLVGSRSDTGIISVIVGSIFAMILFRKQLFKSIYITIPLSVIAIIAVVVLNIKYDNIIVDQIQKVINIEKHTPPLKEIQTNANNVVVNYNDNILQIDFSVSDNGSILINAYDDAYMPINHLDDVTTGSKTLQDERFPGFVLTPCTNEDGALAFSITIDGYVWYFTNQVLDYTYYHINVYGKYDKMTSAPSALFTGYESFATRRGYLWSRTIPLLKNNIIVGSGPDTFVFEFPNQDYVNKYNFGFSQELVTKPHNIYLQIGVQTGVLSMISFIIFYLIYFITSIKLYMNGKFSSFYSYIGVSILIGTFCYMFSGIAYDSSLAVAPLFWLFMGLGIAVNGLVKKEKSKA